MAATKCRISVEFRNGDGNYRREYCATDEENHGFVPCRGENDVEAIETAFLLFMQGNKKRVARMLKLLEESKTPHRD